jgi:hypothetical protein
VTVVGEPFGIFVVISSRDVSELCEVGEGLLVRDEDLDWDPDSEVEAEVVVEGATVVDELEIMTEELIVVSTRVEVD